MLLRKVCIYCGDTIGCLEKINNGSIRNRTCSITCTTQDQCEVIATIKDTTIGICNNCLGSDASK